MIDFPTNPTVGQMFQVGNIIYKCVAINPAVWSATAGQTGVPEAPVDGKSYGRRSAAWEAITKSTVGLGNADNTSDADKPISNATQTALNLKYDKTGGILTGNVQVNIPANQNAQITLNHTTQGNASDIYGSYNNVPQWLLRLGSGGAANPFQLIRMNDAGAIVGTPLTVDRGNGWVTIESNLTVAGTTTNNGQVFSNYNGGGDSFYAQANGGFRSDKGASTAFYAPNGGITVGTTMSCGQALSVGTTINANGRITSSASDVAALYAVSQNGGIYNECNTSAAFRSTNGGATMHGGGNKGYNLATYAPEGGYSNVYGILGNPNWNQVQFQLSHQHGVWAGARILGGSNEIQFVTSNAGGWGSVRAASFEVQSDERLKREITPLAAQHAAFMAITPISWKWKDVPFIPMTPLDVTNVDGTKVQNPPPHPVIDDAERIHWGFSAQNLTASVARAVRGELNAVDEDGKIIPVGVNPIPIIALTVLEVQNLFGEIADLKARLTALGG